MNRLGWSILKSIMVAICQFLPTLATLPALAMGTPADQASEYFNFVERVSHFSPLEHAGSHGTLGVGLGLGMSVYEVAADDGVMQAHWRAPGVSENDNASQARKIYFPRTYFHKGLPGSVDLGVSYGQDPVSKAVLASGYAQWTAFEGFALPALAFRGGVTRLMGLATTDSSVLAADIVASYGFLRLFTVYGTLGQGRYQVKVRSGESYGTTLSLNGYSEGDLQRISMRATRSFGAQVQILPPFCIVALESSQTGQGPASYLAKISVGM